MKTMTLSSTMLTEVTVKMPSAIFEKKSKTKMARCWKWTSVRLRMLTVLTGVAVLMARVIQIRIHLLRRPSAKTSAFEVRVPDPPVLSGRFLWAKQLLASRSRGRWLLLLLVEHEILAMLKRGCNRSHRLLGRVADPRQDRAVVRS